MTKGRTPPSAEEQSRPAPVTSPVDEWYSASEDGELYRLPGSGKVARLRRPSLYALLTQASEMPNKFSKDITRLLAQSASYEERERLERLNQNARAFQEVAALCFVEPAFALDRAPVRSSGEIGPGQLTDQDYLWLFYQFVEGQADDLQSFRVS